jgi:hypothetical protein
VVYLVVHVIDVFQTEVILVGKRKVLLINYLYLDFIFEACSDIAPVRPYRFLEENDERDYEKQ